MLRERPAARRLRRRYSFSESELLLSRLNRARLKHLIAGDVFGRSHRLSSKPVEITSISRRQVQLDPGAELGCVEIVLLLFRQPHAAFRHGLLVDVQRPKLTRRGVGAGGGE